MAELKKEEIFRQLQLKLERALPNLWTVEITTFSVGVKTMLKCSNSITYCPLGFLMMPSF